MMCYYLNVHFQGQRVKDTSWYVGPKSSILHAPPSYADPYTCMCKLRLKCDGTRAETRFRLSAKRSSPFKSKGASVQSTTCSRGVRISGSNTGYIMFRGSVKSTDYQLHSPVSLSLPLPYVTVCHHISPRVYNTSCRTHKLSSYSTFICIIPSGRLFNCLLSTV